MQKKAFSLIELLVVIAIMAILASIAVLQYTSFKIDAKFSQFKSQLDRAKSWAESVIYIAGRFPNGECNTTGVNSGSVKCMFIPDESNPANDRIVRNPAGDLIIDVPFKAIFQRNTTDIKCGWIIVTCNGGCGGLTNSTGNGPPKICVNTCTSTEEIHEDTNLHGVVNGGCP